MEKNRKAEWHLVGWSVFLVAFTGMGAVTFDTLPRQMRVLDQGPANSSDAVLMATLGVADGSARISACLESVPAGSMAVVLHHPSTTLCAQLICLAAWDKGKKAVAITSDSPDANRMLANGGAVAAFWLGGTPPLWFSPTHVPTVLNKELGFGHLRAAAP